jgi:hypothetical protein
MKVTYILSPYKELFNTYLFLIKNSSFVNYKFIKDEKDSYYIYYPDYNNLKFCLDNESEDFNDIEMNFEDDIKFIENFFNGGKYFYFSISYKILNELKELISSIILPKDFDYEKILINDSFTDKIYTLKEYLASFNSV